MGCMKRLLVILAFATGLMGLQASEVVSKVYACGDVSLQEVQDAVKPLLSEKGKTVLLAVERKILVQDEPGNMVAVDAVMKELLAPRPNVRVQVTFDETDSNRRLQGVVKWNEGRVTGKDLEERRTTRESHSGQFLVVQSGRQATLVMVTEVPMVDFFYDYALGRGYIGKTDLRWRSIGTQLAVRPRVLGNNIEVEVLPQITRLVDGRCETINCRELTTTVTVGNGMEVSLGGFKGASDEFNRNFFGTSSGVSFRLSARVMDAELIPSGDR